MTDTPAAAGTPSGQYPDTPEKILARLEASSWDATLIAEAAKLMRNLQNELSACRAELASRDDSYAILDKLHRAAIVEHEQMRLAKEESERLLAEAREEIAMLRNQQEESK